MKTVAFIILLLTWAPTSWGQIVNTQIDGNRVTFSVSLPGGLAIDYGLTFENVVGLSIANLGLDAEIVSLKSKELRSRLPHSKFTTIPVDLPVMVTINPPQSGGLSFEGVVEVDVHTHNLAYTANTPLRLFKASDGEPFYDITDTTSQGSYRARGTTGKFSQFMIISDSRTHTQVIQSKLSRLEGLLKDYEGDIDPLLHLLLSQKLDAVATQVNLLNYTLADTLLTEFMDLVIQAPLFQMPDVWQAGNQLTNVAGELRALAKTLRYTLRIVS